MTEAGQTFILSQWSFPGLVLLVLNFRIRTRASKSSEKKAEIKRRV